MPRKYENIHSFSRDCETDSKCVETPCDQQPTNCSITYGRFQYVS